MISSEALALTVHEARPEDAMAIDELRHRVYACELGQYPVSPSGRLSDSHPFSTVLCARRGAAILGFIAITPPGSPRLRIEHYVDRSQLPFRLGPATAEARQLTVAPEARDGLVATRLLFGCIDWLEKAGVEDVVSIGHDAVLPLYVHWGATRSGLRFRAGQVEYEALYARMSSIRDAVARMPHLRRMLERQTRREEAQTERRCPHGGMALGLLGDDLRELGAMGTVVDADVLDAWFPPSPQASNALAGDVTMLARTSPPPFADGLVTAIARRFALDRRSVAVGAGSSDLIYRSMTAWLGPRSRVLVLDPSYGEYAHVAETVCGASVERLGLSRSEGYVVDADRLRRALASGYDLVVLVNPNNPTGLHVDRTTLLDVVRGAPTSTRIWVDEAYAHFLPHDSTLLADAAGSHNLFVCRTLSKSLALSGLRVAFLAGPEAEVAALRHRTPPWIVGFAAQVAALRALEDMRYYERCYRATRRLRSVLAGELRRDGLDVLEGQIGSVLVHLGDDAPTAQEVVRRCGDRGVFLRDASDMGTRLGPRVLRIAVKDARSNARVVRTLRAVLQGRAATQE
jgi:histidinol-phosphate/aromatic aminotransferase/cobyric acid decarboxylase-like protein